MSNPFVAKKNPFVDYEAKNIAAGPNVEQGLPPALDIAQEHVYANSDQFRGIVAKAQSEGIESLPQDERQQVEKAIKLKIIPPEVLQKQKDDKFEQALLGLAMEPIKAMVANQDKPFLKQYAKALQAFGGAADKVLSQTLDVDPAAMFGGSMPEVVGKALDDMGLDLIEPGQKIQRFNGRTKQWESREATIVDAISSNLIGGAIRLVPELAAGFVSNPYEFMKGFVTFPIEEIQTILDASNLTLQSTRSPIPFVFGKKDHETVQHAKDELIKNPIGVVMLGAMAMGIAGKVAKSGKPVPRSKVTMELEAYDQMVKDVRKSEQKARESDRARRDNERIRDLKKDSKPVIEIDEQIKNVDAEVRGLSNFAIHEEVQTLRPDLPSSVIAALDRKTLESIVLAEELPKRTLELIEEKKNRAKEAEKKTDEKKPVKMESEKAVKEREAGYKAEDKTKPVEKGFNTHGRWADAKEILELEKDRGNEIAPGLEEAVRSGEYEAIWVTKEAKEAVRYNRTGEFSDIAEHPPTKAELSEIMEVDLKGARKLEFDDGDGGSLWIRKKTPKKEAEAKPAKPTDTAKQPYEMTLTEFEKFAEKNNEVLMSEGLKRLHDHRVRAEGLGIANDAVIQNYFKQLDDAIRSSDNIEAHFLDEAISEYNKGNYGRATQLTEATLQYLHQDELAELSEFRARQIHESYVEKAISEGKIKSHPDYPELGKAKKAKVKRPDKAEVVDTDFKEADTSRNLAHHRREYNENVKFLERTDIPDGLRSEIKDRQGILLEEITKFEEEVQTIRDRNKKPEKPNVAQFEGQLEEVVNVDRSKIFTDTERFQKRKDAFAKASVDRIVNNFDPAKLDPLVIWKDPNGKQYVLSGHSRFEATGQLGVKKVPVREFKGTEAEAKAFARESNLGATEYTLAEKVGVYKEAKDGGATKQQLKDLFGDKSKKLDSYTYLDPNGKFIEILNQEAKDSFPYIERLSATVGEIVKRAKDKGIELSKTQEAQMFDGLYGENQQHKLAVADFVEKVELQVYDAKFTKDTPIVFKNREIKTGAAADKNTRDIVEQINRQKAYIKDLEEKSRSPHFPQETHESIKDRVSTAKAEIVKLEEGLQTVIRSQGTLELTPEGAKEVQARIQRPDGPVYEGTIGDIPVKFDGTVPAKPISVVGDIIPLMKAIGAVIRIGHFKRNQGGGRVLGIFKRRSEVVRLGEINDLSTAVHEFGHWLDKRKKVHDLYKEHPEIGILDYDQTKLRHHEGFAEYMRHWLTGSGDMAAMFPEFTKKFNALIKADPKLNKQLAGLSEKILEWRTQGAQARVRGSIGLNAKAEQRTPQQAVDAFRSAMIDVLDPIRRATKEAETSLGTSLRGEQSPYALATALKHKAPAKAQHFIEVGTMDFDGNVNGPSLRAIFEPVKGKELEAVDYAYSLHAMERWKKGKNPGVALADAKITEKNLRNPVYQKFAREFSGYRDRVLDYVFNAGGIGVGDVVRMRAAYEYSMPLYRYGFDGTNTTGIGSGFSYVDQGKAHKGAKGSGRQIVNPLVGMMKETEHLISFADRQRVAHSLIDLSDKVEGFGEWIEEVNIPTMEQKFKVKTVVEALKKQGLEIENVPIDKMDDMISFWTREAHGIPKDNIVTVYRGGKIRAFQLQPDLYRALKHLDYQQIPTALKLLTIPKKMIAAGATGVRASFGLIRNPQRDIFDAFMQSKSEKASPWRFTGGIYYAAKHKFGMELPKNMETFFRQGGEMGDFFNAELPKAMATAQRFIKDNQKSKAVKIISHPIDLYRDIITTPESAPRVREFADVYDRTLSETGSHRTAWIEGMNAASDVTINFSRSGHIGHFANQVIPFFNPSLQGYSKFVRTFKENPKRTFIRGTVGLTVPTLALWYANKDKEWYKRLPSWRKVSGWNFKVGEQLYYWPKPFMWGMMFAAAPEGLFDSWYRKEPKIAEEALGEIFKQSLPPIIPAGLGTTFELAAGESGYDFFRDRYIVSPYAVQNKPAGERYTRYTTDLAKWAGAEFGVSPSKIEHAMSGYTGGIGLDALRAADQLLAVGGFTEEKYGKQEAATTPLIGTVYSYSPYVSAFYDQVNDLREEEKNIGDKALSAEQRKKSAALKSLERTSREIGKQRKLLKSIVENPNLSSELKQAQAERIDLLIEQTTRRALNWYDLYVKGEK